MNGFAGNLNFFLSGGPDANGDWTQAPNGIYPGAPFPQNLPIGPGGPVEVPLQIHVNNDVAPGTYTVAVTGYGSNTPLQFGTFTVVVLPVVPQASAGDSRVTTISATGDAFGATHRRLRRCRSTRTSSSGTPDPARCSTRRASPQRAA